jgi:cullin-4
MRAYSASPSTSPFDLSVSVLSTANWPSYPATSISLPLPMSLALERFKTFYVSKHSGRTLTWAHGLDHCSVRAVFPKGGRKELAVSLFQTVVLLLFNSVGEGGKLGFQEIVEATRLGELELAGWRRKGLLMMIA